MMRSSKLHATLAVFALLMIFIACKKTPAPQFHFDYFGLTQGRYVIYDVVDITHNKDLAQHDTLYYQLKTYWGNIYIDNDGRTARELYRYVRDTPADPWAVSDLWTGIIDGIRGEIIEENQRVVKMVFSPSYDKEWDANAYNLYGELDCYYRDIHSDTVIGGINFDSTVVVEQEEYFNLIDSVRKYEMYAKDIGLIYKYYKDIHFQIGDS